MDENFWVSQIVFAIFFVFPKSVKILRVSST